MENNGYEKRDMPVKPLVIGGISFILIVAVTLFLLFEYYVRVMDNSVYDFKLSKRSKKLIELRESEKETLSSYKIIDEENGVYQIPIERSKELLINEASK